LLVCALVSIQRETQKYTTQSAHSGPHTFNLSAVKQFQLCLAFVVQNLVYNVDINTFFLNDTPNRAMKTCCAKLAKQFIICNDPQRDSKTPDSSTVGDKIDTFGHI